jgi:hypothetical protein
MIDIVVIDGFYYNKFGEKHIFPLHGSNFPLLNMEISFRCHACHGDEKGIR